MVLHTPPVSVPAAHCGVVVALFAWAIPGFAVIKDPEQFIGVVVAKTSLTKAIGPKINALAKRIGSIKLIFFLRWCNNVIVH